MSRTRWTVFVVLVLMSLGCGLGTFRSRPAQPAASNPLSSSAPHMLLPHPTGEQTSSLTTESTTAVSAATPSPNWKINHFGQCCEGNLAAQGNSVYVLLPILVTGNQIWRSDNDGQTWTEKYPPANASVPFGVEGDLQAWGDDIDFFGTLVAQGISAHSTDRGETWIETPINVAFPANDQAWSYLGPLANMRPGAPLPTDRPYVLAGWYRIGSVVVFSFDGGLTWGLQTPLVGDDGSGPSHVVCQETAHAPNDPGDTRVPDQNFTNHKAGRHGAWGTDRKFYWTETGNGDLASGPFLYVCKTDNFGATWTGIKHPMNTGNGLGYVVTHTAFDNNGTLYVLHGDQLYVSFNQGESFAFVHTMPRWGNALLSDSGADQFFVVNCGTIHVGLIAVGSNGNDIYYLRGSHVDTPNPTWDEEYIETVGTDRLDFFQIVLDGNGIPTMSYTTPGSEVTTASRYTPMPLTSNPACLPALQSVVSRKTHGALSPPGDLPLTSTGPATIEPRSGGIPSGNHTLVFQFANTLNLVSGVTATATTSSGTQTLAATGVIGTDRHLYTVDLTGVPNASHVNVTLNAVTDATGNIGDVSAHVDVLFGDVNGSGRTDAGDVTQVRNRTVTIPDTTDPASFRYDVNTSGRIDAGDVTATRNATVTVLPP
jgi:hypothetical protein